MTKSDPLKVESRLSNLETICRFIQEDIKEIKDTDNKILTEIGKIHNLKHKVLGATTIIAFIISLLVSFMSGSIAKGEVSKSQAYEFCQALDLNCITLQSDEVNAFALTEDYVEKDSVFLTTGLLKFTNLESFILTLLHEKGHLVMRHGSINELKRWERILAFIRPEERKAVRNKLSRDREIAADEYALKVGKQIGLSIAACEHDYKMSIVELNSENYEETTHPSSISRFYKCMEVLQ